MAAHHFAQMERSFLEQLALDLTSTLKAERKKNEELKKESEEAKKDTNELKIENKKLKDMDE